MSLCLALASPAAAAVTIVPLENLDPHDAWPYALNDHLAVTGESDDGAFFWQDRIYTPIPLP